jgi:uncharacterized integral membrane protein (TIGR00698 family)
MAASLVARLVPLAGAAVIAILIGLGVRQMIGLPSQLTPGVRLATKHVLQLSIVLLGSGLSLAQVWTTSRASLLVMLGTLVIGLGAMLALGRLLGVERTLARLIAVGTGICGASAIGALAPAIAADQGAIAYAISTVFLYNIGGVLLFPPLGHLLHLSQHGFGLWAGTAINDTSSVVAAAYSFGPAAGAYAVVVKLTRTVMIVPVVLLLAALAAREQQRDGATAARGGIARGFPYFIILFLAASLLNTAGAFHPIGVHTLPALGQFLIVVALAGVGLSADLRAMARTGLRPILLGLLGWIVVAVLSLAFQHVSGGV